MGGKDGLQSFVAVGKVQVEEPCAVSPRTVYRDLVELQHQGVSIEGEAGVGYRLGRGLDLPLRRFPPDETRALVIAIATLMARRWLNPALVSAAGVAMSRVMSGPPAATEAEVRDMSIAAPGAVLDPEVARGLHTLREASQHRNTRRLAYLDLYEQASERES